MAKKKKGKKKAKKGAADGDVNPSEGALRSLYRAFKKGCSDEAISDESAAPLLKLFKSALLGEEVRIPSNIVVSETLAVAPLRLFTGLLKTQSLAFIRSMCFWNADIGDEGVTALAKSLRYLPGLNKLEVLDCLVSARGCQQLAKELGRSAARHVSILRLDHNPIGDEGMAALATCLGEGNTSIRTLSLSYCGLTAESSHALVAALQCSELRDLSLEGNSLRDAGVVIVGRALALARKLERLNLALTEFGDEGDSTVELCTGIAACPTLRSVDINGNLIGDANAAYMAEALQTSTHLQEFVFTPFMSREVFSKLLSTIAEHKPKKKGKKKGKKGKGKKKKKKKA